MSSPTHETDDYEPDDVVALSDARRLRVEAQAKLVELVDAHDGSIDADHRVAVAQRKCWNLRSVELALMGEDDLSAQASREAVRQGELAIKLSKSTLADRVLALEQALDEGQRKGRGIAEAAERKRRKQQERKS